MSVKQTKSHAHERVKSAKGGVNKSFGSSIAGLFEKDVVSLDADSTVFEAAQQMLDNHVGNIVITEEQDGKTVPIGIVTDRDIVVNAIAQRIDPESASVSEIMTSDLVTANESDDLATLVQLIAKEGVSRVPVIDEDGNLAGILSSKRLVQFFAQGLCELSSLSREQQHREESKH